MNGRILNAHTCHVPSHGKRHMAGQNWFEPLGLKDYVRFHQGEPWIVCSLTQVTLQG